MSEITRYLEAVREGDEGALDHVFEALHGELKRLARMSLASSNSATLTPTALVNELYLKFNAAEQLSLSDRCHFFSCAAAAMRQITVDTARAAQAKKRGDGAVFVTLTDPGMARTDTDFLALDEAMESLELINSDLRKLVELRFFAGLSMDEIAALQQRSVRSLHRDWSRARAFLHTQLAAV